MNTVSVYLEKKKFLIKKKLKLFIIFKIKGMEETYQAFNSKQEEK